MAARQPLGRLVAAVSDEGFVQTPEARCGIRGDVLEVQRLEHIDHEIGTRILDGQDFALHGQRRRLRCQASGCLFGSDWRGGGTCLLRGCASAETRPDAPRAAAPAAPAAALFRKPRRFNGFESVAIVLSLTRGSAPEMHVTRRYREEIVYPTPKAQSPMSRSASRLAFAPESQVLGTAAGSKHQPRKLAPSSLRPSATLAVWIAPYPITSPDSIGNSPQKRDNEYTATPEA